MGGDCNIKWRQKGNRTTSVSKSDFFPPFIQLLMERAIEGEP